MQISWADTERMSLVEMAQIEECRHTMRNADMKAIFGK
jgi:hypothetical protein